MVLADPPPTVEYLEVGHIFEELLQAKAKEITKSTTKNLRPLHAVSMPPKNGTATAQDSDRQQIGHRVKHIM